MTNPTYPDAIVKDGVISDLITGDVLPSYEGLCLADCSGRMAIMFTSLTEGGRNWELVHWGSTLSTTEIEKYMRNK